MDSTIKETNQQTKKSHTKLQNSKPEEESKKDDKPSSMEHQENKLESKVLQVNCLTQSIIWQRGVQPKTVYIPSCYAPLGPIQNSFMNLNCKKIVRYCTPKFLQSTSRTPKPQEEEEEEEEDELVTPSTLGSM
jgi:hypothetical protein